MAKDATGNNPASGRGSNTFTSPGTSGTTPWFWLALIIVIALFAIGLALRGRNRVRANIEPTDPAIRAAGEQKDADVRRREDQIRKVG
jgi:hypothetical protein